MSECKKKCRMCDKRGLPLLLTRYAIAPEDIGASGLGGNFKIDAGIPLGGKTLYTQRLLRSGYLYVYDEARKNWQAYFISPQAFFMPIDLPKAGQTRPAVTGDPNEIVPCHTRPDAAIAGCITVSDAENASKIWLGFSDVEWTQEVLNQHQQADYRKKHMRLFDVQAWLGAEKPAAPHAGRLASVGKRIIDYAQTIAHKHLEYSVIPKTMRLGSQSLESLIKLCEARYPGKAAVIALEDPAGIAMDLASLMDYRKYQLDQKHLHPLAASNSILMIKESIEHQAEIDTIVQAEMDAGELIHKHPEILHFPGGQAQFENLATVSKAQLNQARQNAWQKYAPWYQESQRSNFQKKYNDELKTLNKNLIAPLDKAHAAWMESSKLAKYMQCNFDSSNIESGKVYSATISACIGNTQDKIAARTLYTKWMGGDLSDTNNLLARALLLDQEALINQLKSQASAEARANPWKLPWAPLFSSVGGAIDKALERQPDLLGDLMLRIAGVTTHIIDELEPLPTPPDIPPLPKKPLPLTLVAQATIARKAIVPIKTTGTLAEHIAQALEEIMLAARAGSSTPSGLRFAIGNEIKAKSILGLATKQEKTFTHISFIDIQAAEAFGPPQAGSVAATAERSRELAAKSTITIKEYRAIREQENRILEAQRQAIDDQIKAWEAQWQTWSDKVDEHRASKAERQRIERITRERAQKLRLTRTHNLAGACVLGAVLQTASLITVWRDIEKASKNNKDLTEHSLRFFSGILGLAGSIAEPLGLYLEKLAVRPLPMARGFIGKLPTWLQTWGRRAGVVGGILAGAMDVVKGFGEAEKGNTGLGLAYGIVGALGIIGAALMLPFIAKLIGASVVSSVGFILVLFALGLAVLIQHIEGDSLQQWLGQGYFGKNSFANAAEEMKALKEITA